MAMVFMKICLALLFSVNFAIAIGVNWGSTTSHNLEPQVVAQMLKDNGIDSIKLFRTDASMIKAFAKTGINVMIGVPNEDLKKFSDSYINAKDWVKNSVLKHVNNEGVNITYVAVGNEPFLKDYGRLYLNTTFPAIKNIQKALDEAGLGDKIKATTPLNEDIYDLEAIAPSKSDFREDIKDIIVEMVRWFDTNKSPFLLNINPFNSFQNLNFPEDSVFFTPKAKPIVTDKNTSYDNVFDLTIDKLASCLISAGVPDLKIVVGEIGWPTEGDVNANKTLAQRFYSGFLKKLGNNKGTPLRPGPIEIYLSSLLDENMRSITKGNHERHWGIFRYDGQPKYPIDFSGQGNDVMPVAAKGVKYLNYIFCEFSRTPEMNMSIMPANIEYICKSADCTALTYGSSCNNLSYDKNISYMFNMYFQMYSHSDDACNFNGMGSLSFFNVSTDSCLFPLQLKSAGELRVGFGATEIVVGVMALALLALF